MHRWIVLFIILLAGCADTRPQEAPDDAPQAPEEPVAEVEAVEVAAPPAPSLLNRTTFYWAHNGSDEPLALWLRVDLGQSNECEVRDQMSAETVAYGTNRVQITEYGDGRGWGASSRGEMAYAHGMGVDTRQDTTSGGGGGASTSWWRGTFSGTMDFTFVALRMMDRDFGDETLRAAAITIECDEPFDVLGGLEGSDVSFFDPDRSNGTAGAGVGGDLEAGYGLSWQAQATSAASRFVMAGFGDQVIDGTITTPDGEHQVQSIASSLWETHEAGNGTYSVDMDWAGAAFYAIWGVLYSFDAPLDIAAGMADEATIGPSPF